MPTYVLHIHERLVFAAKHGSVNRPGFKIQARRPVDLVRQRIKPRRSDLRVRQSQPFDPLHHVAENGSHRAAARPRFLAQLIFVVRFRRRSDNDGFQLFIELHLGNIADPAEHSLIEEETQRQIFRVVTYRHRGEDLRGIQEDRERPFFHYRKQGAGALMRDPRHSARELRRARVRSYQIAALCSVILQWHSASINLSARHILIPAVQTGA